MKNQGALIYLYFMWSELLENFLKRLIRMWNSLSRHTVGQTNPKYSAEIQT